MTLPSEWVANPQSFYDENKKLHKENGPAVIWAHGTKRWYKHGKLHREDGPAIEWLGGYKEYYIDGKKYSEQDYHRIIKLLYLI